MIKELVKIIERLEIPRSDPATRGLQQRGLEFYRNNEMKRLKDEVLSWYSEVERYDTRTNAMMEFEIKTKSFSRNKRNQNQEFEAISYLFSACIFLHDKNDDGRAIKAASYALAIFRQTSREVSFNEGLALWFRGILYRLNNDNRSAVEDFKEAVDILDERVRGFELQSDYKKISYYLELRTQIAARFLPKLFSEIVGRLIISAENSSLHDWLMAIRKMEPSDLIFINSYIKDLETILASETEETSGATPFDVLFLVHCYNLGFYTAEGPLEYQEYALVTATERFDDYPGSLDAYNQSVSHMYIAFLYYNTFDVSNGLSHLKEANDLLERLLEENINSDTRYIQSLQADIQAWINQFETEFAVRYYEELEDQEIQQPRVSLIEKIKAPIRKIRNIFDDPSAHDETPYTQSEFDVPQVVLNTEDKNKNEPSHDVSPKESTSKPILKGDESFIRHLVIPVDIRALDETNREIVLLEHEHYEKLESFEMQKAHFNNSKEDSPSIKNNTRSTKRTLVPSFPIYGNASAGPNGEAHLPESNELERAEIVDETLVIKFDGMEYKVSFIDSLLYAFSHNKRYGWFKVTGKSMNKADILEDDYVLFRENRNLESCAKKIVIALLSDMETQPPRLMVKRLVKMSGEVPCNEDGFESELCKFVLHSESYLEFDPKTGLNFKKDIEIENDYQLIGDVIAIAKRR